jgi:hypothetical protein
MIETTELFSLLSLVSKNLEAHCSHEVLTVLYGSQSEKNDNTVSFQIVPKE